MGREWNRFFWPMTALVVALIAVTVHSYCRYGAEFWNAFYPQFLATVFGVVFSIMFAWALWRLQQRAQESRKRQQLLEHLTFEVSENLKWLENLKTFLVETSRPENTLLIRGLRTITMKYALKPENLILLRDFDLEYDIDLTVRHCEEFNHNYHQRFRQFLVEEVVASTEQHGPQRARTAFGVEIWSEVNLIRVILEQLTKKLEKQTTRSLDTPTS